MNKANHNLETNTTLIKLVRFLIVMWAFVQITTSMESPVLSIYLLDLAGDLRHVGAIFSTYTFSLAISILVISRYSIEYKYKLLVFSFTGVILYCIAMSLHPPLHVVYIIQFFGGVMNGLGVVGFLQIFVHSVKREEYTKYYSINKFIGCAVGAIAAACSGFIAHHIGTEYVFLFMAGIASISLSIALLFHYLDKRQYFEIHQKS